jgi:uncharacterized phage protein (predicted DNA packaging)
MKWLTVEYIKKHSRIDYDCEDDLLELYGEAAEETVMNITGRDYDDIVANFGTEERPIPAAIIQASLILVDTSYMQRTAVSQQQMSAVPYAFDMLIKPYMRLAGSFANDQRDKYVERLYKQKQLLDYKCCGVSDPALLDLYRQIRLYMRMWSKIDNPDEMILDDMKVQTERIEQDCDEIINQANE